MAGCHTDRMRRTIENCHRAVPPWHMHVHVAMPVLSKAASPPGASAAGFLFAAAAFTAVIS
ncbi:MAG: hypothetical protein JWM59_352 [Verrucomicrobiales bacterium]|nr:hypothetical protein [Verrucomicrobiales bacterium]